MTDSMRTKSGKPLHPIGIGTWKFGEYSLFSPGAEAEAEAIQYSIKLGQNHIDTAEMYANGGAEKVVGQAIAKMQREDLFIASKIWRDHVAKGTVRPAVEAMLKRLGIDYLDILYIHYPWFDAPWQESVPQIDELIDEGLVRYLGASNFNAERLNELINLSGHQIVADQMHYSLLHQNEVTPELSQLCENKDIAIVAYTPLERGQVSKEPIIKKVAEEYGVQPSQIALAWIVAHKALPIPKALKIDHCKLNAEAGRIKLQQKDIQRIDEQFKST